MCKQYNESMEKIAFQLDNFAFRWPNGERRQPLWEMMQVAEVKAPCLKGEKKASVEVCALRAELKTKKCRYFRSLKHALLGEIKVPTLTKKQVLILDWENGRI